MERHPGQLAAVSGGAGIIWHCGDPCGRGTGTSGLTSRAVSGVRGCPGLGIQLQDHQRDAPLPSSGLVSVKWDNSENLPCHTQEEGYAWMGEQGRVGQETGVQGLWGIQSGHVQMDAGKRSGDHL